MKLYTEAEIVNFLKKEFADEINAETFMKNLTPIELPSDEEINKEALNYIAYSGFTGFTTCAVWFRDKIIKRNDNQQFK